MSGVPRTVENHIEAIAGRLHVLGALRARRVEVGDGPEELGDEVRRLVLAQFAVADRIRKQQGPDLVREARRQRLIGEHELAPGLG